MPDLKPRPIRSHRCVSCGALEGQYHKAGCPEEICALCGGLQTSCIHGDPYKRVPFIRYPLEEFCVSCGEKRPTAFRVPDIEWAKYVQPGKRKERLCQECYDRIKTIIDRAGR